MPQERLRQRLPHQPKKEAIAPSSGSRAKHLRVRPRQTRGIAEFPKPGPWIQRDGLSSPFRHGPLRTNDDVEWITAGCVKWYNARRLYSTLGDTPPDEFEAAYYAGLGTPSHPVLAPA